MLQCSRPRRRRWQRPSVERDFDAAIRIGHRVLAIDADADNIELALLRAYKAGGRHAAAAEQYAHYSAYVRDELGIDPPAFQDL